MDQKEKQMVERIMDRYGNNRVCLFVSCSRRAVQRVFDFNHTGKSCKFCRQPFHGCPADDCNGYAGPADIGYDRRIFESVSESESLP